MAKISGGPNLRAISARRGAKNVINTIEKNAPTKEEVKARGQRLTALPLPRHRVTVESGGDRPRLAGDVEKDRGDGPAEKRAPVNRSEKNDCGGGGHGEGHGKQNRDAVGAPQSREHADDRAQQDADYGHEQVEGRDRDVKAE